MAELTLPVVLDDRHAEVLNEARALARAVEPMAMEADECSTLHRPTAVALTEPSRDPLSDSLAGSGHQSPPSLESPHVESP